jgi:hypothetical protein
MGLFEEHRVDDREMDVWDFVSINPDVVVCTNVGNAKVWRVANVEGIRRLKSEPQPNANLSACETDCYPSKILLYDLNAAFHVRWYRECSQGGDILPGFQNHEHACMWEAKCVAKCSKHKLGSCNKCCKEPILGRTFYLPMHEDQTVANEPVTEIPACVVMDTVQMAKCDDHMNVWMLSCGNKELILQKFEQAGGIIPLPNGKSSIPIQKKLPKPKAPKYVKRVLQKVVEAPAFHASNALSHQKTPHELLGCHVHVYWPHELSWYLGVVVRLHRNEMHLMVHYEDGDEKWHDFDATGFLWGVAMHDTSMQPTQSAHTETPPPSRASPLAHAPSTQPELKPVTMAHVPPVTLPPPAPKCLVLPTFDSDDAHWHGRPPKELLGCTIHVFWPHESLWFKGVVMRIHSNDISCMVHYADGDKRWEDFSPGGCLWGLARVDPILDRSLNAKGRVSLNEFQHGNPSDIIVSHVLRTSKKSVTTSLTRWELQCLGPGAWLSGDVIELCIDVLCTMPMCRVTKHMFYGALVQTSETRCDHGRPLYTSSLKTWFKSAQLLWTMRKLFVIVNVSCSNSTLSPWKQTLGNHWVLAVIDIEHHTFRYYDPLGSDGRHDLFREQRTQCVHNLVYWLRLEHDMAWLQTAHVESFAATPCQGNSFDCGIFSIMYALCEAMDVPPSTLPFGQQHAPLFRECVTAHLLK